MSGVSKNFLVSLVFSSLAFSFFSENLFSNDVSNLKSNIKQPHVVQHEQNIDAINAFEHEKKFFSVPYSVNESLDKKLGHIIIDVRDEDSFVNGHIPTAINLPISKFLNENWSDEINLELILPNKSTTIHVYCYELLCHAAETVAIQLAKNGYKDVKVMKGGFDIWEKKYPDRIEK